MNCLTAKMVDYILKVKESQWGIEVDEAKNEYELISNSI